MIEWVGYCSQHYGVCTLIGSASHAVPHQEGALLAQAVLTKTSCNGYSVYDIGAVIRSPHPAIPMVIGSSSGFLLGFAIKSCLEGSHSEFVLKMIVMLSGLCGLWGGATAAGCIVALRTTVVMLWLEDRKSFKKRCRITAEALEEKAQETVFEDPISFELVEVQEVEEAACVA